MISSGGSLMIMIRNIVRDWYLVDCLPGYFICCYFGMHSFEGLRAVEEPENFQEKGCNERSRRRRKYDHLFSKLLS